MLPKEKAISCQHSAFSLELQAFVCESWLIVESQNQRDSSFPRRSVGTR